MRVVLLFDLPYFASKLILELEIWYANLVQTIDVTLGSIDFSALLHPSQHRRHGFLGRFSDILSFLLT